MSLPHLPHCAHQTLSGFAVTEDAHLSQNMSPSTNTHSMNRRNLPMRNGQGTPIPLGGSVSRSTMSSSLPTLPSVPSDQLYDTMEITKPTTMQVESASREEPSADASYGPGRDENRILRMTSQESSIRHKIFEELARSKLESMERDARFALFYQESAIQNRSWWIPKTSKRCRQPSGERIFRKLRCYDARPSRYSESI